MLWVGICITIVGGLIIGLEDFSFEKADLRGDALALAGAVGLAGYWLAGRHLRKKISTLHYAAVVYGSSGIILLSLALLSGASLYPYTGKTLLYLLLIALVPQVIGHTSFNFGLKFISAPVLSVLVLGEPVGAILLAYFILGEHLSAIKIIGGAIVLLGVYATAKSGVAGEK